MRLTLFSSPVPDADGVGNVAGEKRLLAWYASKAKARTHAHGALAMRSRGAVHFYREPIH